MHTIATHRIPRLFSAYAVNLEQGSDGTIGKKAGYVRETKYHCNCCRTDFTVNHQWKAGMFYGGGHFGDGIIFCPYCGHRHENFTRRNQIYFFDGEDEEKTETSPLNIEMTFMEYKQGFILKVKSETLRMEKENTENGKVILRYGSQTEEFRFDVKNRTTTFSILTGSHRTVIKKYELGSPFDHRIYEDSKLLQVQTDNKSEEWKAGTIAFLKTVRNAIRDKWKEIHGFDIGSLFVGYGQVNGRLLFPLVNIAFRMVYPDAKNLPPYLNGTKTSITSIQRRRLLTDEAAAKYEAFDKIRKEKDTVTAIIKAFNLPDKPAVRKLLNDDLFAASEVAEVFTIATNIDQARNLWNAVHELIERNQDGYYGRYSEINLSELYKFLRELREHYKVKDIIRMLTKQDKHIILDTKNMLSRLAEEKKPEAWQVKPKDLHDWLINALRSQEEEGYKLKAPEHIKRRLMMQMDMMQFFLPEHTAELVNASNELHNCVRTYGNRILAGDCQIVLMTDDLGKLVACLEVRGKNLVQAKLKHNRPVGLDGKINHAVLDWCEKANLAVKTQDVLVNAPTSYTPMVIQERMAVV